MEMELEIQQYEKAKAVREEQLERLTQICQEQAVSTAPLSQQAWDQLQCFVLFYFVLKATHYSFIWFQIC